MSHDNPASVITSLAVADGKSCSLEDEDRNTSKIIIASIGAMLIIYILLLLFLTNNVRHIVKTEKYKNFHMTFFYLMAYAIIMARILFFGAIVEFIMYQLDSDRGIQVPTLINTIDSIATYTELILGFQQMCSMIELYLMLRFSTLYKINQSTSDAEKQKAKIFKKLRRYRVMAVVVSSLVMLTCLALTFVFKTTLQ